ncbi:hypothetical protein [Myroides odoratus]|jgi:hypothetical protein|uniref:Uncharacterized protein n=1 Tax=Myroides odoratus TaxID=256 RepID=A0A9Q6Z403_MYROD|nr:MULTISPECIES: hypothetical protein [Myroides]EHQ40888.1 hypothetical protein Myrod_0041 [Myroides odoratus DSM 2801]EHQ44564.1 hypothetical protein Myrod_3768 [Myroides odoratus DSM 2801]EKB08205.1 hypothetical protein HMPREF9716_01302 [Myroides odoratus CIP 103059]QQU01838.1 hypothetical protein I6I88_08890 [Myroides odoratus]WHT38931.1 hypothetical protein QNH98_18490 [Myroides sp. mNGS23_01]
MNKKIEKITTYLVLLLLVYGIYQLDIDQLWSIQVNWFSFLAFLVFFCYLIFSLKKAAKQQDLEKGK